MPMASTKPLITISPNTMYKSQLKPIHNTRFVTRARFPLFEQAGRRCAHSTKIHQGSAAHAATCSEPPAAHAHCKRARVRVSETITNAGTFTKNCDRSLLCQVERVSLRQQVAGVHGHHFELENACNTSGVTCSNRVTERTQRYNTGCAPLDTDREEEGASGSASVCYELLRPIQTSPRPEQNNPN